jgi:hypothetical protein
MSHRLPDAQVRPLLLKEDLPTDGAAPRMRLGNRESQITARRERCHEARSAEGEDWAGGWIAEEKDKEDHHLEDEDEDCRAPDEDDCAHS